MRPPRQFDIASCGRRPGQLHFDIVRSGVELVDIPDKNLVGDKRFPGTGQDTGTAVNMQADRAGVIERNARPVLDIPVELNLVYAVMVFRGSLTHRFYRIRPRIEVVEIQIPVGVLQLRREELAVVVQLVSDQRLGAGQAESRAVLIRRHAHIPVGKLAARPELAECTVRRHVIHLKPCVIDNDIVRRNIRCAIYIDMINPVDKRFSAEIFLPIHHFDTHNPVIPFRIVPGIIPGEQLIHFDRLKGRRRRQCKLMHTAIFPEMWRRISQGRTVKRICQRPIKSRANLIFHLLTLAIPDRKFSGAECPGKNKIRPGTFCGLYPLSGFI